MKKCTIKNFLRKLKYRIEGSNPHAKYNLDSCRKIINMNKCTLIMQKIMHYFFRINH